MIDYLYQIDYDDLLKKEAEEPAVEEEPQPESPVAKTVAFFETLDIDREEISEPHTALNNATSIPEPEVPADAWSFSSKRVGGSKKDKKKRRSKSRILHLPDRGEDVDRARLTINTQVYAMADRYEITDLKALAKAKFEEAVLQDWESLAFAHAAELVFSTTHESDQGLRSVVIQTINEHRDLANYEEIQKLFKSDNGMAWALLQVIFGDPERPSGPYNNYR